MSVASSSPSVAETSYRHSLSADHSDSPISAADMLAARRRKRRSTNRLGDEASRYSDATAIITPAPTKRYRPSVNNSASNDATLQRSAQPSDAKLGRMPIASTPFPRRRAIASPARSTTRTPSNRTRAILLAGSKVNRAARDSAQDEPSNSFDVTPSSSVASNRNRPAWMARWGAGQEESPIDLLRKLAAAPGFEPTLSPATAAQSSVTNSISRKRPSAAANKSVVSDLGQGRNRRVTQDRRSNIFDFSIDQNAVDSSGWSAYPNQVFQAEDPPSVTPRRSLIDSAPSIAQEETEAIERTFEPTANNDFNYFDLLADDSAVSTPEAKQPDLSVLSSVVSPVVEPSMGSFDGEGHHTSTDNLEMHAAEADEFDEFEPTRQEPERMSSVNQFFEDSQDDDTGSDGEYAAATALKRMRRTIRVDKLLKPRRTSTLTGKKTQPLPANRMRNLFSVMITPRVGMTTTAMRRRSAKVLTEPSALDAVEDISHDFFVDMAKALSSIERVNVRGLVDERDLVALLRANGFLDQRTSLLSLARKYLPRELSDLLSPDADHNDDTLIGGQDEADETFVDELPEYQAQARQTSKRKSRKRISLGYVLDAVEHLAEVEEEQIDDRVGSHKSRRRVSRPAIWSEPPTARGKGAKHLQMRSDGESSDIYSSG